MDVHEMLLKVQRGEVDLAEAEDYFKKLPYEDIGCAKIDHHRGLRSGFGEVIYSPGKTWSIWSGFFRVLPVAGKCAGHQSQP